jgi:hypothetical protein
MLSKAHKDRAVVSFYVARQVYPDVPPPSEGRRCHLPVTPPPAGWTAAIETTAAKSPWVVVVDGSYALKSTSVGRRGQTTEVLRQLKSLIEDAEPSLKEGRVSRVIVVDSPLDIRAHGDLVKAGFEVIVGPYNTVAEEQAQLWLEDGRAGPSVMVQRQRGVDSTIATVLLEQAADPGVGGILLFSGDGDFAETLLLAQRCKAVRLLTFADNMAGSLYKIDPCPIDLSVIYRVSTMSRV